MIISKQSRAGDIHERLYRLAKKKPVKEQRLITSISEKVLHFNPGEALYIKGEAMKHSKMRLIEEKIKERKEKEEKELTFKPSINAAQGRFDERTEDILIKKAKDYQIHKKTLKEKFDKEEVKDCSFQPNLGTSKCKKKNNQIHEQLYKEAHKRQEKQIELSTMKLFPFEPNQDKPKSSKTESKEEFIDRLFNSKKKLQEEMNKLRELQDLDHDSFTGQRLYKPETLHNPEATSRKGGKLIWEYLYDMKDTKKENIKKVLEDQEREWQESSRLKIGTQSQKMLEKCRIKQYKKIFEEMDSDGDGRISAVHINLEGLHEKTLEVLSPLLEHLLSCGEVIEFQEFSQHLEELRNQLDLNSRSWLLKRSDKVEILEIDPYPMLNANSLEIAERIKTDESIYDRQLKSKMIAQLKFQKKKELQQEMIVKDCSFRPNLDPNAKSRKLQ